MECDACGHPAHDPQEDQQRLQYDRTYTLAADHLRAGNWDQATGLLRPLLNQHPTDRRLYLAILRACTRDFRDLWIPDMEKRSTASEAWDKLARLDGITDSMIGYARRRYEAHRQELTRRRNALLAWIFGAAFCAILTGAFLGTGLGFPALIGIGGTSLCLYRAGRARPFEILRQLAGREPDFRANPFT